MSDEDLRRAAGLPEACRILFGDDADAQLAEYFASVDAERAVAARPTSPAVA